MIEAVGAVVATAVGAVVGSFVGTAALRSLRQQPFVGGRSHCDGCQLALGFGQTVPVVSYLVARGGCSACGARIDPAHLAAELLGATAALTIWIAAPWPQAGYMAVMGAALLAASVIDARSRRLPDLLTVFVAITALLLAVARGPAAVGQGLLAAFASIVTLAALRWTFSKRRRDPGLGLGDVKLIAALALWLGIMTPTMVAVAAVGALAVLKIQPSHDGRIAFGPMIAVSGWCLGLGVEIGWWGS